MAPLCSYLPRHLASVTLLFLASHTAHGDVLESELQSMLNTAAFFTHTALSLGVALPDRTISLSAGRRKYNQPWAKNEYCKPTDKFAMGSTTKMYTAAAVLRHVDKGTFKLDDKALPLMDPFFKKLNGSSLVDALGTQIENVTVRELLQMRSGIPDFDNTASRDFQFEHPTKDLGPNLEISFIPSGGAFSCSPGACGVYSSTNYELLGLLLAQAAGSSWWDTYDQAADLPTKGAMLNSDFGLHGTCSKYTAVHGYSKEKNPAVDVYNVSCTNGWTCGNLVSNAADAALFVRELLGSSSTALSAETRAEMLKTVPLSEGWGKGLPYGLGVMDLSMLVGQKPGSGSFVGHGGETFGFNAQTGYVKDLDIGISVVSANENLMIVAGLVNRAHATIKASMAGSSMPAFVV